VLSPRGAGPNVIEYLDLPSHGFVHHDCNTPIRPCTHIPISPYRKVFFLSSHAESLGTDCVSIALQPPHKPKNITAVSKRVPSQSGAMVGPSERLAPTISFTVFSRSNLWAGQPLQAQPVELQKLPWLTRWHCLAKTRILASAHLPLSSIWTGRVAEQCLNCLKLIHRRRLAAKIQPPGLWLNSGEQTKRSSVTFQFSRFASDKTFSRCDRVTEACIDFTMPGLY